MKAEDINVLMPMLGGGTRMKGAQNTCKPLYKLPNGGHLFVEALKSLSNYNVHELILLVLPEYEDDFRKVVAEEVEPKFGNIQKISIVPHEKTPDQVATVLAGLEMMKNAVAEKLNIISLDCDITGELPVMDLGYAKAGLFGFKHHNPNKSFIKTDGEEVVEIVEKQAISNMAVFGAYMFSADVLEDDLSAYSQYDYISKIYRHWLDEGEVILWKEAKDVKNYGTIEEWEEATREDKQYKALMFDFDGTLFDTKKLNFKAYQLAYFDLGVTITEEMFDKTDGLSVYEFNQAMGVDCDVEKLRELKKNYYADMVKYATPNRYLIKLIKKTNCKTALVTSARLVNIDYLLKAYELKFDVMITQEDVAKHKPEPDSYNLAIERLGLSPEECLAFEDSRPGFVAARKAGADCVMVGKFEDDCIRNMSGGSDATTKLIITDDNQLVVRKEAKGKGAGRLYNQLQKLLSEKFNPDYIHVVGYDCDEEYTQYDMPYRPAPSAYEYLNKIKLIPELLGILSYNFGEHIILDNTEDIRKFCWETYIKPGMEIYKKVTGKELNPIYTDPIYIPQFVNDFRKGKYHGDSTLENVLVQRNGELLLIDPVPDGNAVNGLVHDFSKVAQSLTGYEAIRDGKKFDYTIERDIFNTEAKKYLTPEEFRSLKFHTACLLFRRLKHQIEQNPSLVEVYGDIAWKLLDEFAKEDYNWR